MSELVPTVALRARQCKCGQKARKTTGFLVYGDTSQIKIEEETLYVPKKPNERNWDLKNDDFPVIIVECLFCQKHTFFVWSSGGWNVLPPKGWEKHFTFQWDDDLPIEGRHLQNVRSVKHNGWVFRQFRTILDDAKTRAIFPSVDYFWSGFISLSENPAVSRFKSVMDEVLTLGGKNGLLQHVVDERQRYHNAINAAIKKLEESKRITRSPSLKEIRLLLEEALAAPEKTQAESAK